MTPNTLQIDGSGKDGMLVTWEPGQLPVDMAQQAFTAVNAANLLPKSSTKPAALRTAFSALIEALNIKVRGMPINITPLREDLIGFEAVRVQKGQVENEHEFVMSVVLEEDSSGNAQVKIAKFDHSIAGPVAVMQDQFEDRLTRVYLEELNFYPVGMISSALQRLIMHLGGISLRKAGGAYFLPSSAMSTFETVADSLEASQGKLRINTVTFPLRPTERSYRWVLESLDKEVNESLAEIEEELKDLGGSKQRTNGKETRLEHAASIDQKISSYESLLNVTLTHLHDAVNKVKCAVEAHNLMEVCS
jgi:hypothetical protein